MLLFSFSDIVLQVGLIVMAVGDNPEIIVFPGLQFASIAFFSEREVQVVAVDADPVSLSGLFGMGLALWEMLLALVGISTGCHFL